MEVNEALLKRRSTRKYLDKEISDEQIDELLHAAMSGPSACNKKPWEFYVIKNKVRSYDCYWNETKQKYTGLLDATMYDDKIKSWLKTL